MAELLIKAIDANHPDPKIDLVGCYKCGDIVVIKPDGWKWGKCEGPPKFVRLKLPGLEIKDVESYLKPGTVTQPKTVDVIEKEWRYDPQCESFIGTPTEVSKRQVVINEVIKKENYNENIRKYLESHYFDTILDIKYSKDVAGFDIVTITGSVTKLRLQGKEEIEKIRRAKKIKIEDFIFNEDGVAESKETKIHVIKKKV